MFGSQYDDLTFQRVNTYAWNETKQWEYRDILMTIKITFFQGMTLCFLLIERGPMIEVLDLQYIININVFYIRRANTTVTLVISLLKGIL